MKQLNKLLTLIAILIWLGKAQCDTALIINEPDPFPDITSVKIGEPGKDITWDPLTLVSQNTSGNCGALSVQFFADEGSEINTWLAQYDNAVPKFSILRQTNTARVGISFSMYYTVTLVDYPSNSVQSNPFNVVITKPCVAVSITPPNLGNIQLTYTITAPELIFNIDAFVVDPPECEMIITVDVTPPIPLDSPIKTVTATELRVFQEGSLDGIGDYVIKITGRTSTLTESVTYGLTIADPCKNEAFISITKPDNIDYKNALSYTITAGSQAKPIEYKFDKFVPIGPYQLCGNGKIKIKSTEAKFKSMPVDYDLATGILRIYSSNKDLIGTRERFKIITKIVNGVWSKAWKVQFNYLDPCIDKNYVSITPLMQQNTVYYYDGTVLVYEVTKPLVSIPFCQISHTCSMDPASPILEFCNYSQSNLQSKLDLNTLTLTFTGKDKSLILMGDYTFIITSTISPGGAASAESVFTLTIKDPCKETTKVSLDWATQTNPSTYFYSGVYEQITLSKPIVTPSDCPITYNCAIRPGSPRTDLCQINLTKAYGDFDLNQLTYSYQFSSQVEVPFGQYEFIILAELSLSPGFYINSTSFVLTLASPCLAPNARIIRAIQTNPDRYFYSENVLEYGMQPFKTDPPGCPLTITCQVSAGARTDLCQKVQLPELSSIFNPQSLQFSFKATTVDVAPQGDYTFFITAQISGGTATGASSFTLTLWSPCHSANLQLKESSLFPNLFYKVLDPPISFPYLPQQLITYEAPTKDYCGAVDIQFVIFENGKSLDPAIFDEGFVGASDTIRNFSILSITDPAYFDRQIAIEYIVSLADYPTRQVSNIFYVKFTVLDWCDPKILKLIDFEPAYCSQDESDDKQKSNTEANDDKAEDDKAEDDNIESSSESDDDVKPSEETAEANNSTDRSSKPINQPEWFYNIDNQVIVRGESNLNYFMGNPVSYYGELMIVTVDFFDLSNATYFDPQTNQIIVDQLWLPKNETGYQNIEIQASYFEEATNEMISFNKTIYLLIIEPGATEAEDPDLQIDLLQSIDKVSAADAMQMKNSDGSVPFIKSLSWDGKLSIGWSRKLRVQEELETLLKEKIAVQVEVFNQYSQYDSTRGIRRLQISSGDDQIEEFFVSDGLTFKIADVIEISQIVNDELEDELEQTDDNSITWQVLDYSTDELVLQVNQVSPQPEGLFMLTFWGTKYFQDDQQRQVAFGTQLKWRAYRQALPEDLEQYELLLKIARVFIILICIMVMIQIVTGGSILPFWMFFNTLQLLTHLVLIRVEIPVVVNILLTELLNLVRFQFDFVHDIFAIVFTKEKQMTRADFFNKELFSACGYSASLMQDMAPGLLIIALTISIWVLLVVKDLLCLCRKKTGHEAACFSVIMRIVYECFFEIVLCLLISQTIVADNILSLNRLGLGLTVTVGLLLAMLCFLCFRCGPYVNGSYKSGSLTHSFWAHRPIRIKHITDYEQKIKSRQKKKNLPKSVQKVEKRPSDKVLHAISEEHSQSEDSSLNRFDQQVQMAQKVEKNTRLSEQNTSQVSLDEAPGIRLKFRQSDSSKSHRLVLPQIMARQPQFQPFSTGGWNWNDFDETNQEKSINMKTTGGGKSKQTSNNVQVSDNHEEDQIIKFGASQRRADHAARNQLPMIGHKHSTMLYGSVVQSQTSFETNAQKVGTSNPGISINEMSMSHDNSAYVEAEEILEENKQTSHKSNKEEDFIELSDYSLPSEKESSDKIEVIEMYEGGQIETVQSDLQIPQSNELAKQPDEAANPERIKISEEENKVQDNRTKHQLSFSRLKQLQSEAKVRVILEQRSSGNKRFKSLFNGLRGNSEHNVAIVYPFLFLVRRIAYASSLIFLYERPNLVMLSLIVSTMFVLAYVLAESPWKSSLIHHQHVWNEIGLYLSTLTLQFLTQSRLKTISSRLYLSWVVIGIVAALFVMNTFVILRETFSHLRLMLLHLSMNIANGALYQKKGHKKFKNKVAPQRSDQLGQDFNTYDLTERSPSQRDLLNHKINAIEISDDEAEADKVMQCNRSFSRAKSPNQFSHQNSLNANGKENYSFAFDSPIVSGKKIELQQAEYAEWLMKQAHMKAMLAQLPSEAELSELLKGRTAQEKRVLLQEIQKTNQQKIHLEYLMEQDKIRTEERLAMKNVEDRQAIEQNYIQEERNGAAEPPSGLIDQHEDMKNYVLETRRITQRSTMTEAPENFCMGSQILNSSIDNDYNSVDNKLPDLNAKQNRLVGFGLDNLYELDNHFDSVHVSVDLDQTDRKNREFRPSTRLTNHKDNLEEDEKDQFRSAPMLNEKSSGQNGISIMIEDILVRNTKDRLVISEEPEDDSIAGSNQEKLQEDEHKIRDKLICEPELSPKTAEDKPLGMPAERVSMILPNKLKANISFRR